MQEPACRPHEDIIRGITTADWDHDENRVRASFFKNAGGGQCLSVSRLAILSRREVLVIFESELVKPPERNWFGTGTINIGEMQEIARTFQQNPTELTVWPDPTPTNPAHASIPEKISRGLSNKLGEHLIIERD
jgi:hypothetical protein